jgi:hypothetical protein
VSQPAGGIRLEGGPRLRRTLQAAGRQLDDLKDLHKRVAELVAGRAKTTAPEGPPSVHVADTIRAAGTKSAAIIRAGKARVGYAKAVHWGHRRAERIGGGVVAARPWITEAAQDLQPRWESFYVSELQSICDSVEGTTTP